MKGRLSAIDVDEEDVPTIRFTVSQVAITCGLCGEEILIPDGMAKMTVALMAKAHARKHRV